MPSSPLESPIELDEHPGAIAMHPGWAKAMKPKTFLELQAGEAVDLIKRLTSENSILRQECDASDAIIAMLEEAS